MAIRAVGEKLQFLSETFPIGKVDSHLNISSFEF